MAAKDRCGGDGLVIDACHSARSVDQPWFKPGPMGSRGLGQLAYDKRMRVLAASQADDFAIEDKDLKHGLLTYALVEDGLVRGLADFQPRDGDISVGEWLAFAVQRVPELHKRLRNNQPIETGDAAAHAPGEKSVGVGVVRAADPDTGGTKKAVPATPELIAMTSLAKEGAFQTPVLFDFARGEDKVLLNGTDIPASGRCLPRRVLGGDRAGR